MMNPTIIVRASPMPRVNSAMAATRAITPNTVMPITLVRWGNIWVHFRIFAPPSVSIFSRGVSAGPISCPNAMFRTSIVLAN
ncbi:hypothetical protein D3C84_725600 [compost metagenome]